MKNKKVCFKLAACAFLVLTMQACAIFGIESIQFQKSENNTTEEIESLKKDSIIMRCSLNYVKINAFEKINFPYMGVNSTLNLNYNGGYSGFAGCNSHYGKYIIDGNKIEFKSGVSTRKGCSHDREKWDIVGNALFKVNNFTIKNGQMFMMQDGNVLIVYDIIE